MSGERKLYGFPPSPPTRAVLLTLKALNLDFTFEVVNTLLDEQKKPELVAKNPQHTVPILEEPDGTCLWDSHAICAYLVRRYGKNDTLYPKDFYKRAVVDQRLHFENSGLFFDSFIQTVAPVARGLFTKSEFQAQLSKIEDKYDLLEKFFGDNQYMAGNSLTIADLSIVSSIHSIACIVPIVDERWPKLAAWLVHMSQLPYYGEVNTSGVEVFEAFMKGWSHLLQ